MAFKRKRTFSRNSRRVRRKGTRIFRPSRPMRSNNRHMFKRTVELGVKLMGETTVGGAYVPRKWAFVGAMSDLPNLSEFTSLYDQYRINKIKYQLTPNFTELDAQGVPVLSTGGYISTFAAEGLPNIHSVIDYDDSAIPGNLADYMQYSTYKRTRGNREHVRYWTPSIMQGLYASATQGGTSYSGNRFKQWIDLAATDVPHYGLKFYMDPGFTYQAGNEQAAVPNLFCRVYVTYYFECRGVR